MYKILSDIKISKVESSSKYLLEVGDRSYYIGELIYFIIVQLQLNKENSEISFEVNKRFKQEPLFNEFDIGNIIEKNIKQLGVFENETPQNSVKESIKGKIKLLNDKSITYICNPIKFLYTPLLFTICFIAAIALNVYFIILNKDILNKIDVQNIERGIWFFILLYPIIFLIFILHEFGHAVATFKFKTQPKSIGFGFYFLIPVLYTDVTGIWELSIFKRIIVNLAGLYVQLLLNIILFFISFFISDITINSFIFYIIIINSSTFALNLIPFVKYDAYWIYSDLTNNPNLKSKSVKFLYDLFLSVFQKNEVPLKNYKQSLIVYSFFSFFFFLWLYYKILTRFYYEVIQIKITWEIIENFSFSVHNLAYVFITILTLVFGIAIIYSVFKIIYRYVCLLKY